MEESSKTLDEAVTLAQTEGALEIVAEALRYWGMTKLFAGDPDGAEGPISESLEVYRQLGDARGEAWALQNRAWISFNRGEMGEVEERLDESAAKFRSLGDWGGLGWVYGLLGFVRYFQGRYEEAGKLAESILVETRDSGDRWGLGMTYMLLANVRLFDGHTIEAVKHASEALELFRSINDTDQAHMVVGTLARALVMSGQVEDGLAVMEEHMPTGSPNFAGLIPASTAVQLGEPETAQELLSKGFRTSPISGDAVGFGEMGVQYGLADLQLGKVTSSLTRLRQAAVDAHTEGERAFARAALALALTANGEPEAAIETAESLPAMDAGTYIDKMMATVARGLALVRLERADEAESALADASRWWIALRTCSTRRSRDLARGIGLEALGKPDAARVLHDAQDRLTDIGIDAHGWETAFRLAAGSAG